MTAQWTEREECGSLLTVLDSLLLQFGSRSWANCNIGHVHRVLIAIKSLLNPAWKHCAAPITASMRPSNPMKRLALVFAAKVSRPRPKTS